MLFVKINQPLKMCVYSQAVVAQHTLIPVLGRLRQEDLCELKASLVYRISSGTARATQRGGRRKGGRMRQRGRTRRGKKLSLVV